MKPTQVIPPAGTVEEPLASLEVKGTDDGRAPNERLSSISPKLDAVVLTVTETAEILGISRAFAYELVARGELPAVKLGRRIVVPTRVLDKLLDRGPGSAA
jgi:excisionase family DNA binding protein